MKTVVAALAIIESANAFSAAPAYASRVSSSNVVMAAKKPPAKGGSNWGFADFLANERPLELLSGAAQPKSDINKRFDIGYDTRGLNRKAAKKGKATVIPYSTELGVIAPTGFWDPLGLSLKQTPATFAKYRAAELKHGRVAQLACVGYVVQEAYRFPFEISPGIPCEDVPNGLAALGAIPALGWLQIIALIGFVDKTGKLGPADFPPDQNMDKEELAERQLQELQHGRLAMLATLELFRHDAQSLVAVPDLDIMKPLITGLPFLYDLAQ